MARIGFPTMQRWFNTFKGFATKTDDAATTALSSGKANKILGHLDDIKAKYPNMPADEQLKLATALGGSSSGWKRFLGSTVGLTGLAAVTDAATGGQVIAKPVWNYATKQLSQWEETQNFAANIQAEMDGINFWTKIWSVLNRIFPLQFFQDKIEQNRRDIARLTKDMEEKQMGPYGDQNAGINPAITATTVLGTGALAYMGYKGIKAHKGRGGNQHNDSGNNHIPTNVNKGGNNPVIDVEAEKGRTGDYFAEQTKKMTPDQLQKMQDYTEKLKTPSAGSVAKELMEEAADLTKGKSAVTSFKLSGASLKGSLALGTVFATATYAQAREAGATEMEAGIEAARSAIPGVETAVALTEGRYSDAVVDAVGTGGALAGASIGAAWGAAAGSVVPLAGTAIGGFVGGIAGGTLGYFGFSGAAEDVLDVGKSAVDYAWDNGGEQFWAVNKTLFNTASDYAGNKLTEWFGTEAADSEENRQKDRILRGDNDNRIVPVYEQNKLVSNGGMDFNLF